MLNKDVTHSKMRRRIENPRILLLDCPLEFKKGESQTSLELSKEEDFAAVLAMEEEFVKKMCDDIIKFKPDLVVTEKGLSGLFILFFFHLFLFLINLFIRYRSTLFCQK